MILEPSDIAVDVVGDYFLIIDNDSESSYKTLKIDKNLSDKYSLKIKTPLC